jgi:hypothetical protein
LIFGISLFLYFDTEIAIIAMSLIMIPVHGFGIKYLIENDLEQSDVPVHSIYGVLGSACGIIICLMDREHIFACLFFGVSILIFVLALIEDDGLYCQVEYESNHNYSLPALVAAITISMATTSLLNIGIIISISSSNINEYDAIFVIFCSIIISIWQILSSSENKLRYNLISFTAIVSGFTLFFYSPIHMTASGLDTRCFRLEQWVSRYQIISFPR